MKKVWWFFFCGRIFFVYYLHENARKAWEVSSVFQILGQFPLNIARRVDQNVRDVWYADTAPDFM